MKGYVHKLPRERIDVLLSEGKTYEWILDNYYRPSWCLDQTATHGGCFALMDLRPGGMMEQISRTYCGSCPSYKRKPKKIKPPKPKKKKKRKKLKKSKTWFRERYHRLKKAKEERERQERIEQMKKDGVFYN